MATKEELKQELENLKKLVDQTKKDTESFVKSLQLDIKKNAEVLKAEYRKIEKLVAGYKEPTEPKPPSTPITPPEAPQAPQTNENPLAGLKFYKQRTSVDEWVDKNATHPKVGLVKEKIARHPMGIWISSNWPTDVKAIMADAEKKGEVPVFIVYNSIKRDLGSHSAGGAKNLDEYLSWLAQVSRDVNSRRVIYIMEPDCLPHMPSMSAEDQKERVEMLQKGIDILTDNVDAIVYLDAGHSKWKSAKETAELLKMIGYPMIALNTSNRRPNDELVRFAEDINKLYPLKGVVLDTSRNAIPQIEWCDAKPEGAGLPPTTDTGKAIIHAYLWLKIPGEADGCIAKAGQLVPERLIMLAENAVK